MFFSDAFLGFSIERDPHFSARKFAQYRLIAYFCIMKS